MKSRKGNSPKSGDATYKKDLASKPMEMNKSKVEGEAKKRKSGGEVKAPGAAARANGGRAPRKSGGRAGCESSPFSSARAGTNPPGHKAKLID